jgi:large repetitive protein
VVLAACGDNHDALPPTLEDVVLTTAEDTPRSIAVPVAATDDALVRLTIISLPSHGTLSGTSPRWTYTPAANYNGSDRLTVGVEDPYGTDTAMVTIQVTAVNDAPSAMPDSFAAGFETPLAIMQTTLLANDGDIDSTALSVSAVAAGTYGTPVISGNTVMFTPEIGFEGTATFSYTLSDGAATAQGTVTVTVGADEAPVANNDAATTDEDAVLTIADATLVANDTDVEHNTLAISAVANPSHGTVSHTGTDVTFIPEANYHGAAGFEYTVTDGYKTSTASVVVTINSVNDVPVATADARTATEDTPLALVASTLATNDSDVDGDGLTVSAVTGDANTFGTVALLAGAITYTPTADFHGTAVFGYTVSDGNGGNTNGTVTVTVDAVNDAPLAVADAKIVDEDAQLSFAAAELTSNDTDVDGDSVTVTAVAATADTHGTVGLAAGTVTYTPTANFNGIAEFSYTISDGNGGTASSTMAVAVSAVNDAPVVTASAGTTTYVENAVPVTVDLGVALSDIDGLDLTGATVQIATGCTAPEDVLALAVVPPGVAVTGYDAASCTLTLAGAGSLANYQAALRLVTYQNTSDAPSAAARAVRFTVNDGANTGTSGVDRGLGVTPVDDGGTAVDDVASLDEDAAATPITVLDNDTDVDGGPLAIASVTQPDDGTVVITGGGTGLTYTPNGNFCNTAPEDALAAIVRMAAIVIGGPVAPFDTFTYTLAPGDATATVSVAVTCSDDAPTAADDAPSVDQDSTANVIDVLANDLDVDGGTNTIASITQPTNGAAAISPDGLTVTYTPFASYCNEVPNVAPDTFTYTIAPGASSSTVSVTVTCACGANQPTDFVVGSN